MIFYLILIVAAVGGTGVLVYKYQLALFPKENSAISEAPTFAVFMEGVSTHVSGMWNDYVKVEALTLVEKGLRRIRIGILRIEQLLFRMTHRVKDISKRAEETKAENATIAAESSQSEPPSVQ
jgi:urease accessory protein UreF